MTIDVFSRLHIDSSVDQPRYCATCFRNAATPCAEMFETVLLKRVMT
jgi:hypothetical protein